MKQESGVRHVPAPDHILSYFRLEKPLLLAVAVSGTACNVGLIAGPWFEGQLAQCLYDIIGGKKAFADMVSLALLYAAVMASVQVMRYLKRLYVRKFANDVNRNMKHVLYFSLVHKSRAELERESVGGMMTRAVSDVDACAEGMRKFTTEIFDTGIALTAYLAMLFSYDWRLALLACIFPPFAYLTAEKMKGPVHRCTAAYKESAGRLNGATLDRISGALTYRVFGCEAGRDRAYEDRLADYEVTAVKSEIWVAALQPLYGVISMAGVLFIVWFGARNVLGTGWSHWDIAAFTTFLSCFTKLAVKSSHAANLFNAVQQAQVSWKRIKPMMRETGGEVPALPAAPAVLEVQDLSFAFPGRAEVLHGISFQAEPGQVIGVTGPVACGKSTFGKMFLCEFPYSGSIRYAGRELSGIPVGGRNGIVAYLGHQPELMSDTVEQNILLGSGHDAWKYLRIVCLDEEVRAMPDGLQTRVGTGGVRLSGGQQERLALARALCSGYPLLVLDDPFSAVDRTTEWEIYRRMRAAVPDSIVLLLSHRLDLFPEFDRVLWMRDGHALFSTHEGLMRTVPAYAGLYRAQTEGGGHREETK